MFVVDSVTGGHRIAWSGASRRFRLRRLSDPPFGSALPQFSPMAISVALPPAAAVLMETTCSSTKRVR